jgi:hypothetical protein
VLWGLSLTVFSISQNQQNKSLNKKERKQIMSNSVKNFEEKEAYNNLLNELVGEIQDAIETSIKKGEWYKKNTYEIDANEYDEETIDQIIEDIDIEEFNIEGYKVDIQFNDDYTVDYYISVDTDVNDGHLDYELMDKLLVNNYLQNIEDVRRYVKVFNQYNTVLSNDDEFIVIDNEQKTKVTFFLSGWLKWEHCVERIE